WSFCIFESLGLERCELLNSALDAHLTRTSCIFRNRCDVIFESIPCPSGEDVCHSLVGQIGSVPPRTCAAPLKIEAANMHTPCIAESLRLRQQSIRGLRASATNPGIPQPTSKYCTDG